MRIHLKTTQNSEIIPFNYQQNLTSVLHKWLGRDNTEHGKMSLYSFSWLKNSIKEKDGLNFPNGSKWFISFYDETRIKTIVKTILSDPEMFSGLFVSEITIEETPDLSNRELFFFASPIFIQRFDIENQKNRHYTFEDKESNGLLKQTLLHKMENAGLPIDETLDIQFDLSYRNKLIKVLTYNNIQNKANQCPVILKGTPETKAFAWNVGIGHSTGIGFGSIY